MASKGFWLVKCMINVVFTLDFRSFTIKYVSLVFGLGFARGCVLLNVASYSTRLGFLGFSRTAIDF